MLTSKVISQPVRSNTTISPSALNAREQVAVSSIVGVDVDGWGISWTINGGTDDETEEIASDLETQSSPPAAAAGALSTGYKTYRLEGAVEEAKGGGRLRGYFIWAVSLVGIGVVVLVVLFSLDVVSPRDRPCPLDSPAIPTPAQIAVAGDLFRDECVRVSGTVVFQGIDELVVEMKQGEYVQRVNVRDQSEVLEAFPLGRAVTQTGRLKVVEDGTYAVHFVPDHGSDRGWWRNLRDNLEGLFQVALGETGIGDGFPTTSVKESFQCPGGSQSYATTEEADSPQVLAMGLVGRLGFDPASPALYVELRFAVVEQLVVYLNAPALGVGDHEPGAVAVEGDSHRQREAQLGF